MSGKVILVGAGPGDPGLLTLRGAEVLKQADVVVYDRLVGEEILALIPRRAERIDVGKRPEHHPVPQSRINQILLEQAREGKTVVRLKGGDPFLFGRGGEELELLRRHGIPFEVVSGVTSAIAAPASAGIPVTHRDWASSLHIVTGHARQGAERNINFSALAEAGGTCVFLMGMAALEGICAGLLRAGKAPDTLAAVVERGTLPVQRKVTATLATLPRRVREAGLSNPAVIVVGEVAALSEDFDWFSRRPLFGRRVVVTRPVGRGEGLCRRLRELGAQVLDAPAIVTTSTLNQEKIEEILRICKAVQYIAFTSVFGVDCFFDALWAAGHVLRSVAGNRFAAIGSATAAALERRGIRPDLVPEVYETAHLAHALAREADSVLLLRSAHGSPDLPRILREAGIPCTDLSTYETRSAAPNPALREWLCGGECLVTFTSGSTVRGFAEALGEEGDLSRVLGVCIGAPTAQACRAYNIPAIVAENATESGMIDVILEHFAERSV